MFNMHDNFQLKKSLGQFEKYQYIIHPWVV
jgi:hypothetical protein